MGRLQANYNSSKNNKISIKKQNLGGGRLLLNYIFDPKEIQGLSLWLKADAGITPVSPYVPAIINNGYSFDGGTSLTPSSGTGALAFGTDNFSVSFWAYPTSAPDSNQVIVAWGVWPDTSGFVVNHGETTISFYLGGFQEIFTYTPPTVLNVWHHVVVVRTSGTANFYVNGISRGTANWNYDFTDGLWYIGRAQDVEGYFLNGTLDEVGVWNRALSGAEVTALYNSGAGIAYPFASQPSLLSNIGAYWNLNSTLNDQTANARNLTIDIGGTKVASWADQSGNGKNATAIKAPLYATNSINGKPALVFANNEYLTTSNIFNGSNPRTMFAVYYIDSEEYSNTVVAQSNEDDTVVGTYFMLQSRIDQNSSPYLAGYVDDLSGPAFVSPELLIGMADYDGTTARLFKNGVEVNSDVKNYNTHNGQLYIGACNIAGAVVEYFGGKIAEIVLYNRVLTTPERQQVEAYLKAKYAITCGYQNTNKLVQTAGNNAPIGLTFNHIAFDYASFAGYCSALGLNPATILNDLGGVDFSSNYVVIRAKTSSNFDTDSISDLGDGIINITSTGPSSGTVANRYRFFVMCKDGWNTVNFYGVNYPI